MLLAELKSALKQRIAEGANYAIRQLEEVLRPDSDKFNEFVQIKGRYNAYLNAVVTGVASKAELDGQYNQISAALLIFTDSLRDEHLLPDEQAPGPAQSKRGELLYHIPHEMQTAHEYKCAVRVAYLRALLYQDWQAHADDVQKSIPVAEIMSVELLNQDESEPFAIRTFSDTVQFLDQDFHTEWEFYVKPRRAGAFPLLLKISVVETRNGRDVKRNIVLEERVVVSTDAPTEVEINFQKSDVTLDLSSKGQEARGNEQVAEPQTSNPQTSNSRPLRAMALFLAFVMLTSSATWAVTPPATRDWWVATLRDTAESYAAYIEKHRDTGPVNPRVETAYFRRAEKTDSLSHLRLYQEQYPQGNYAPQVLEKIEQHEVRAVASLRQQPDAAKVRQFLVDYPDARHLPEVKQTAEQLPAEQRTELLPAIETGYVRSMQAQPTAQKFEQYRRDYPQADRLTEMAQAIAAAPPAVQQAAQPALDEVIVQKTEAAATAAEVQAAFAALQAAGSPRAAERVAQIVEKKPAAVRQQVAPQVREVQEKVQQRERKSVGVTQSHPDTAPALEAEAAERLRQEQAAEAESQRQQQREKAKSEAVPPPVGGGAGGGVARKSGLDMVLVTGGTFLMGSPKSEKGRDADECQHFVTVETFSIGKYEVTQADWREVMGSNPSYNKSCDDCPVEQVSWKDVQNFLKTLNRVTKDGKTYRLPTEAEWEYAARGGTQNAAIATGGGFRYAGSDDPDQVAWYSSNSGAKIHPVGGKAPNQLGLHDMSGNVSEWCQDKYGPYLGCSEPQSRSSSRVVRGGSWNLSVARNVRSAVRYGFEPDVAYGNIGFRLARAE